MARSCRPAARLKYKIIPLLTWKQEELYDRWNQFVALEYWLYHDPSFPWGYVLELSLNPLVRKTPCITFSANRKANIGSFQLTEDFSAFMFIVVELFILFDSIFNMDNSELNTVTEHYIVAYAFNWLVVGQHSLISVIHLLHKKLLNWLIFKYCV